MKKPLLILSFATLMFSSNSFAQNKVWTKEYEQHLYNQWDAEAKQRLTDTKLRKEFVTFMVKRFKQELPNGLESVSRDSITRLTIKIGKEHWQNPNNKQLAKEVKSNIRPWSKLIEDTLRDALLKNLKDEDKPNGKMLCDCAITELKKIYPKALLIPIPKEALQQASNICYTRLDSLNSKKN